MKEKIHFTVEYEPNEEVDIYINIAPKKCKDIHPETEEDIFNKRKFIKRWEDEQSGENID